MGKSEDTRAADERERQLRELNEALMVSAVHQHELADQAQRAEAALRESELRYRRLFQSAKDALLILDIRTGKITDANAAMCGLIGVEAHELQGKTLDGIGLFGEMASKQVFSALEKLRYVRHDRLPFQHQRGKSIEVEFIANVYHEGERLMAQCNIRDVTERFLMEQKIREQAEELADQHRRKDEFLAMLSHELRNPLAPIVSATHLLRLQESGSENPIQKQAREMIDRQLATLTRLVNDLLEVSRVVTGRIRLDKETVDLNQVLKHALETTQPLIKQRRHELTVRLCPDPVWAHVDATRMEEVFVNLLTNAAKYTDLGGTIEVTCERAEDWTFVRVRDNGAGIAPDLLKGGRIFDIFTQGERTIDRSQGGLGIGLSLAHRLVLLHGGTIEAKSDGPGKGSEFTVHLPLVQPPGEPTSVSHPSLPAEGAQRLRVLVVDDNSDACEALAKILELHGHGVQRAESGPSALAVARAWRPDAILLDIGLPGIDGYEVARRLRADPTTQNIRLVAITGYGTERDRQIALEAGFDAHLAKPADPETIETLLTTWAQASGSA